MAEAARTLKANPKLAGSPCGWCSEPAKLGDELRVCAACEAVHHAACWDGSAGCATGGCLNAPLRRLDDAAAPAAAQVVPPGYAQCPMCRAVVIDSGTCERCNASLSPDGLYHGPTEHAPGAVASLVWAIIGLFVFGMIIGPLAISKARAAKALIKTSPRYTGGGLATAGMVLGVVDLVGWVAGLIMRFSR